MKFIKGKLNKLAIIIKQELITRVFSAIFMILLLDIHHIYDNAFVGGIIAFIFSELYTKYKSAKKVQNALK